MEDFLILLAQTPETVQQMQNQEALTNIFNIVITAVLVIVGWMIHGIRGDQRVMRTDIHNILGRLSNFQSADAVHESEFKRVNERLRKLENKAGL